MTSFGALLQGKSNHRLNPTYLPPLRAVRYAA